MFASASNRVLVTGGAGFIGGHLTRALVQQGSNVAVVDNLSTGFLENIEDIRDSLQFYQMDVTESHFKKFLIENDYDVIFNFASNAYVPTSVKRPDLDLIVNFETPFMVLEMLRKKEIDSVFINISSAAVYGNPGKFPISEDDPTIPISPYGVSKLMAERYLEVYAKTYKIRGASLRFFSVYGPGQKKQIIYDFMNKLTNDPCFMKIIGDGTQTRDMIFVEDVIRAVLLVCKYGELAGEVYNISSGDEFSTVFLAQKVSEAMNLSPVFSFTNELRQGDAEKWRGNINRIRSLGFTLEFSLERGLQHTYEWFQRAVLCEARTSGG